MSYIDKSLGDGETVILRAKFHWLYDVAAWAGALVPGILLLIFLGRAQQGPVPFAAEDPITWATAAMGITFIVCLFNSILMLVRKWTTEVGVTSHRFVEKYGIVALRSNEIAVPNIEGVRVTQGVLGRILGYGRVRIEGTGDDSVLTPTIADPVGFVRAIQTAKEHMAGR